jgi:hypothetical protein
MAAEAEGLQSKTTRRKLQNLLDSDRPSHGRTYRVLSSRRHPSVRTFLSPYSFLYLIGVIGIKNVSKAHLTSRMIRVLAPFLDVSW